MSLCHNVKPDSLFVHIKSGATYTVVLLANERSDKWPVQVIYKDTDNATWARPLDEFIDKFTEKV